MSSARPPRFRLTPARIAAWLLLALVSYLVVPPLLMLLYGSLTSTPPGVPPRFTLDTLAQAYGTRSVVKPLVNSLLYSMATATLALVIGAFLAWLVERTHARVRTLADLFTLVPLLLPAVLLVSGWVLLLAPHQGPVTLLLKWVFGASHQGLDLYSFAGMIWVGTLQELPLAFLWLWPAFRAMNPELEEAARVHGAGTLTMVCRITLPLLLPTLLAAWIIFFITSMGALAVPLLIGLPASVFLYSTEIYLATTRTPTNLNLASAYALLFILIAAIGLYAHRVVALDATRYATVTGKGFRARRMGLGRGQGLVVALAVVLLLITAGLPLLMLLWNAFMPFPQPPSMDGLRRATLANFPSAWNYGPAARAALNSLLLGVGAGVITTLIGGLVAWGLLRQKALARTYGALDFLCAAPIAIPGIIVGISFVWLYLTLPLPIYGTPWILLLAYVTLHLPFAVRICSSALSQVHPELEEAAQVAGGNQLAVFTRILAPLLAPAIVVSIMYISIRAFREYQASIFLTSVGSEVFSILVLDMSDGGNSTILAAYATVVIAGLTLASLLLYWIGRRSGVRV